MENNGAAIRRDIVEEIASVGTSGLNDRWWVGRGGPDGLFLSDAAVDWVDAVSRQDDPRSGRVAESRGDAQPAVGPAWSRAGSLNVSRVRVTVTEHLFFVGPASFTVEDWEWLSPKGLRRLVTWPEECRMIMVSANIWSGSVDLSVRIGNAAEIETQLDYQQREEAAYRVEIEEPYIAWSFNVSPRLVLPALPAGNYRIVLYSAGIAPEQFEAVAAHDTMERYLMVFEPIPLALS